MDSRSNLYSGMECPVAKPAKPNLNISEIVSKFAKVCRLKSIGVFSSEYPNLYHNLHKPICNDASLSENKSDSTEETKSNGEKIHPKPIEETRRDGVMGNLEIMKIFETVSALKLAYLQLQEAHIPYDPNKIIAADRRVVTQLEKLCKFKRVYKEEHYTKAQFKNAAHSDLLRGEIQSKVALLGKLKSQNSAKDSEIRQLQQELQDLEMENKRLAEKIKKFSLEKKKACISNVTMFQDVFNSASKSIHDFAKPLISLMKASGWDLDAAVKSIENGAVYTKRCDKKYAFEAYIARRMFHGISLTCCNNNVGDLVRFDDPIDALIENPHSDFAKFCRSRYLLVVHPMMEGFFFGNLDHRTFVLNGRHPRTEFYQLFAKMAKWVWVLIGAAVSIDPNATLFSVNKGSIFSSSYMESVVDEERDSAVLSDADQRAYEVQFMVIPGFRMGQTLVKSRVYISKLPSC
ncbi:hypothetical protein L6164_030729 [Bauhinia variegata]|uniref:Uncharacterized protein n=1 Tax=Bauhinia variegata TaxID=167791 RepID=A0ACB9LCL7_BAUVA|nr:hypothetical protein L6164_030729 [Bauhinia variegata]